MEELVRAHARLARPHLCPELSLYLIGPGCPLWSAGEAELARLGLPEPYWAFAWPGGQALARYLLDHPEEVRGRVVLDFGAGSALAGLAAARAGARRVVAADLDPVACAAARLNAAANGLSLETESEDRVGSDCAGFDLVLAADVCYERGSAARILPWLAGLGPRVLLSDPGRGWVPPGLVPVAELLAPSDVDVEGRYLRRTAIWSFSKEK